MHQILNKLKFNKHLVFAIALLLPAYFLFFPSKFTTIDEHDYLNNAELILKGSLKTDCAENIPGQWDTHMGYCISKYNIGTSIFILPFAALSPSLAALATLSVFIIGIIVFFKLLNYFRIDQRFIYFFALFPPFIFFSRTLLSELYSMVAILLVLWGLLNIQKGRFYQLFTGLSIISAIYIRYTNLIPLFLLCLYFLYLNINTLTLKTFLRKYWVINITIVAGMLSLFLFNYTHYGASLRSGYYFSSEEGIFVFEQVPAVFFKYFVLLNLFYPFTFINLFKTTIKYKFIFILIPISLVLFYTLLRNESFPGKLSDIILGLRFLIPIYPFMLLPYFHKLYIYRNEKYYKFFLYTFIILLFILSIVINIIHYRFIN